MIAWYGTQEEDNENVLPWTQELLELRAKVEMGT